jgi:hypothetical protein
MTMNPYLAPRGINPAPSQPAGAGPWRDGAQLVAAADGSTKFPERCVKTNLATEGKTLHVKFVWVPNQTTWFLTLGLIGQAIATSLYGRKVSLDLPINPRWLAKQRRSAWIGWSMVVLGVLAFVLGITGYAMAIQAGMSLAVANWLPFVLLGCLVVSALGLVFLVIFHKAVVSVHAVVGDFAWIDGVSPEFLDALPEWND